MSLVNLMNTRLPINRKERFYTGTVFPMIVCRDNFDHFERFLSLLDDYRVQPIDATPDNANIQVFTEYGIKESIYGRDVERFPNPPESRDTPDIIILIVGERTQIIALEAKMFLRPAPTDLARQMQRQYDILDKLRKPLQVDELYLYALVPEQWKTKLANFDFPIVTWNTLYQHYITIHPQSYFLEVLRIALDNFDDLVSKSSTTNGKNRKMSGLSIYRAYQDSSLDMTIMGRNGGFNGQQMTEDFATGRWTHQQYEVQADDEPHNSNWFYIEAFIAKIDSMNP